MTTINNFLPLISGTDSVLRSKPATSYKLDYELSQKAAAGDVEAFEEIYWQHQQRVFSVCYRMSKNVAEAEDLSQLVFIQLFKKIGSFRGNSAFATWLHRMTVNIVLMQFRKKKINKEDTTEDGIIPESFNLQGKTLNGNQLVIRLLIDEAIEKLPKGYRTMVILHDICGFEHREIAEMLNCSSGTSKSQLFKARRKLRKLLSNETSNVNLQNAG